MGIKIHSDSEVDSETMAKIEIARDPSTSPETLAAFANDPSDRLRVIVAENPKTPPGALKQIFERSKALSWDFWFALARNPSTPPEVLSEIARANWVLIRAIVARHPALPPEALSRLASDSDPINRSIVAHSSKSIDIITRLAKDPDRFVRGSVAHNPNVTPQILGQLARDPDEYVRDQTKYVYGYKVRIDGQYVYRDEDYTHRNDGDEYEYDYEDEDGYGYENEDEDEDEDTPKQTHNHLSSNSEYLSSLKRAQEVGDVQFHRLSADLSQNFRKEDPLYERLVGVFTEIALLDKELEARAEAIFAKYGLGGHGFGASLSVYYAREQDKYREGNS